MVNFKKPTTFRLFPFSVAAIFCHYIGYNIVRAILLDKSHAATNLPRVEIDHILYIFTLVEIISLLSASIIIQLLGTKFQLILTFTVIWTFVLGIFHRSITTSSAILVALVSSLIKVGLLSYGAGEYESRYSAELYVYFLFCYLSVILGELGSIYYVPPNTSGKCTSSCFGKSFMASKILVSITFGVVCTTIFYMSKFSFVYSGSTQSRSRVSLIFVARKLVYILIIIAPFPIVWISHQQIVTKWTLQAYLTTPEIISYIFDRDDVHFVYLCCIVIYVSIFYAFFYKKYSKCLCSFPFIAIIIGCILMSFAAITTRKLEMDIQPYTNKLIQPNVSWVVACANRDRSLFVRTNVSSCPEISLTPLTCQVKKLQFDSPYGYVRIHEILDDPDYELELETSLQCRERFLNYYTDLEVFKCADYNPDYYDPVKDDTTAHCKYSRSSIVTIERSSTGLPVVCVGCSIVYYHKLITFYKISSIDQKYGGNNSYYYKCNVAAPQCQHVAQGIYRLQAYLRTTLDNCNDVFHFEMGGVYFVNVASKKEFTDIISITLVGPLEISTMWLLFPIIMMAVGRTLIEVSGLYIIYIQSHPKLKTVSIGCWMVSSRSGDLIATAYNLFENHHNLIVLKHLKILLLCSAGIFLCMAVFSIWYFNKNWAPSVQLDIIGEVQGTKETEAVEEAEV